MGYTVVHCVLNGFLSFRGARKKISKSILTALFKDPADNKQTILARIFAFFSLFNLHLARYKAKVFQELRETTWELDEEELRSSGLEAG